MEDLVVVVSVAEVPDCKAVSVFCDTSIHSNSCIACGRHHICTVSPFPFQSFRDMVDCCLDQELRMFHHHFPVVFDFDDHVFCDI